jgi:hypothetical protein
LKIENFLISYFENILSMLNKIKGSHRATFKTVPHSNQAIKNPLKENANVPSRHADLLSFRFLRYRYKNIPARMG